MKLLKFLDRIINKYNIDKMSDRELQNLMYDSKEIIAERIKNNNSRKVNLLERLIGEEYRKDNNRYKGTIEIYDVKNGNNSVKYLSENIDLVLDSERAWMRATDVIRILEYIIDKKGNK